MHGHESEILTTTFLMLSAASFGLILRWLKQPPLVGYILAGLALGPAGLDLVDLEYVKSHWGVIVGVTFGVLFIKTLLGWALLTIGGDRRKPVFITLMEWNASLSGASLSAS